MPSNALSYAAALLPIRDDFGASHQRFWDRLGQPGAWWTSAERIDIAREVRAATGCPLCQARKAALSPAAVDGPHTVVSDLPTNAIEAIHRIRTDPGRLTAAWFEGLIDETFTVGHYVELLGTLVALVSIDSFCRGIGVPAHPFPAPASGEPTGYRPASAAMEDAWVPMIPDDGNLGAESDLWPIGQTGNVIRAMSLVPDEVRTLGDLGAAHYLPNVQVRDPAAHPPHLDRPQTELIAARVSALNQCFY